MGFVTGEQTRKYECSHQTKHTFDLKLIKLKIGYHEFWYLSLSLL